MPEVIPATGELLAIDQATLRSKVAGRVAKLNVDLGSRVEQGDVIAELEREDYELRLNQSQAAVEQTRARLGITGDTDDVDPVKTAVVRQAAASLREAKLIGANVGEQFKLGLVSKVDFEKAGVTLMAAEARYQAALEEVVRGRAELLQRRSELALARQQLSDTVIRAPFRGAVTERIATLGEYLAVNAPAVVLVRWHPLRVRLQVPERQAFKVKVGHRIDLKFEGLTNRQPGRVVRLSPSIEAQNRSLVVEGEIPNEDAQLRAGSFVEAGITVDPNARGLAVPASAVLSFAGVERVFVAEDGKLAERIVRQGRRIDNRVEIVAGLKVGDAVVVNPSDRFAPGMLVEIEK